MDLNVVKIQRFSTHDGPGIRTVVFLKGCPLSCKWCHNPETKRSVFEIFFHAKSCIGCGSCVEGCPVGAHKLCGEHIFDRELCRGCFKCTELCPTGALEKVGKVYKTDELLKEVLKDEAFYGTDGGVTLSGGEPMLQADGVISFLESAKQAGLSCAIETSGYFDEKWLERLSRLIDLFLWDIKDTDNARHLEYVGVERGVIVSNLKKLDSLGAKSVLRCIIVKGVNSDREHLEEITKLYKSLKNCLGVELIPYHTYGSSKSLQLGLCDDGKEEWIPQPTDIDRAKDYLKKNGCTVI